MPHKPQSQYLPDPQDWAIKQAQGRADGALYRFGEYAMFVLMWQLSDFEAGRVGRCSTCYLPYDEIAEAFEQPSKARCLDCYGTTFDGGIAHKLIRPSLWDESIPDQLIRRHGLVPDAANALVQSTSAFRLRHGDYVFRADGSRWQAKSASAPLIHTGFKHATRSIAAGYNYATVTREELTSVAYDIPPTNAELATLLNPSHPHTPVNYSASEVIGTAPLL